MKEPPDPVDGLLDGGVDDATAETEATGAELTDGAGALEGATTLEVVGSGVLECSNSGAVTLVADEDGETTTGEEDTTAAGDEEATTEEEGTTAAGDEEATTAGAEEAKTAARDE